MTAKLLNKTSVIPLMNLLSILLTALLVNSRDSNITLALLSVLMVSCMIYAPPYKIAVSHSELLLLLSLLIVFSLRCISAKEFVYSHDLLAYILFYLSMKIYTNSSNFQMLIILALVMTGVYEALFGIVSNNVQNGGIIGHFNNPAGYAVFFTGLTPLAHYLLSLPSKYSKIIGWIAIPVFAIAVILSQSRAGIVSLLTFYTIILYIKVKNKHLYIILMLSTVLVIGYFLYEFKIHSANGRLLIWENSIRLISDAPLLGHGFRGFTSKYMIYQADYFRENPNSRFVMLADDTMYPFCEYLGFIIRYGLITFVLVISSIFIACRRSFRDIHKRHFVLSLVCIAVFALFSYPLEYVTTQLIVVVDILFLASSQSPTTHLIRLRSSQFVMVPLFILLLFQTISLYKNDRKCVELEIKTANADTITKNIILEYKKIEKDNHSNPYFLFNYGAILCRTGDHKKSIKLLNECKKYLNNSQVQLFLTENYMNLQQYKKAEYHALEASYMYPSLFRPLYYLTTIYDQTGQVGKAKIMAQRIIEKPMKVFNFDSSLIKAKMQEYLKTNKLP